MELGLARCEHPPEVWPAEAALGAAPGLPHDALELPVALARQRQELRERKVTADAAGDEGCRHLRKIREAQTEETGRTVEAAGPRGLLSARSEVDAHTDLQDVGRVDPSVASLPQADGNRWVPLRSAGNWTQPELRDLARAPEDGSQALP